MNASIFTPVTVVWLLLVGATLASWEFGHGLGFDDVRQASMAIIAVSLFKVRLVMAHFMEVRHSPIVLRVVVDAWLLALCSVLIALYLRT